MHTILAALLVLIASTATAADSFPAATKLNDDMFLGWLECDGDVELYNIGARHGVGTGSIEEIIDCTYGWQETIRAQVPAALAELDAHPDTAAYVRDAYTEWTVAMKRLASLAGAPVETNEATREELDAEAWARRERFDLELDLAAQQ